MLNTFDFIAQIIIQSIEIHISPNYLEISVQMNCTKNIRHVGWAVVLVCVKKMYSSQK